MDQLKQKVEHLVQTNALMVAVLVAVLVVVVAVLAYMYHQQATKTEGLSGAGGPQVNDNALLPVGWEGYAVRRFEGVNGSPNAAAAANAAGRAANIYGGASGMAVGVDNTSGAAIQQAIAAANAAALRQDLGCPAVSARNARVPSGASSVEGLMSRTDRALSNAMKGM